MKAEPLITLDRITVRLRDKQFLQDTSWRIHAGEQWAILGPNGSGKTTLAKALFRGVPVVQGKVTYHFPESDGAADSGPSESIAYVSPELHRDLIQREKLRDAFRDFSGKPEEVTTAKSVILDELPLERIGMDEATVRLLKVSRQMGIEYLLERSVNSLSTGESRKVLIARALIKNPKVLILDKPFDGLDQQSKKSLAVMIAALMENDRSILLITNRMEEILAPITHVLIVKDGKVCTSGEKSEILDRPKTIAIEQKCSEGIPQGFVPGSLPSASKTPKAPCGGGVDTPDVLIEMKEVEVKYGSVVVLDTFNWLIRRGENWAILGPNGAGKTTILKLIIGDNPQSYANDITIFGKKKGSGESIWDIKKNIGVVSSDLQAHYHGKIAAFDVVCSGFFASIGLYRTCTRDQKEAAIKWMRLVGSERFADKTFEQLSFGQRQLILLARAMVKNPPLLILDEPCDGLDADNRKTLLDLCEFIGSSALTHLIYVTHQEDEIPPCVTNVLKLNQGKVVEISRR